MFWVWFCYFAYIHCPIARNFEERSTPLYLQSEADGPGVSTAPEVYIDPGQTDNSQLSSNTVLVAGVAVPVVVLVLAAVC